MKPERFDEIVENRLKHCKDVLSWKNEEYSSDTDRLHNFKVAAAMDETTPENALWGMYLKHLVSVRDIVKNIESGVPSHVTVAEKIGDSINYMLLLEALLAERTDL